MSKHHAIQLADEPLEAVSCPLCDATEHEVVMYARDRLFARPGRYPLVTCSSCGMRYLSPRPTLDAIAQHYPSSYFIYRKAEELPLFVRPWLRAYNQGRCHASLRRLEKVVGRLSANTKVVDVGCGLNDYNATLHRLRGVQSIGVDFKPEVAAYVRDTLGMACHTGTLLDAGFADGEFDLVSMNEYLEHEPHPRQALMEARRITKPGGHVTIEVPNSEGWVARLFGARWSQIDAPRHLVHFTRTTLSEMLRRSGYEPVHISRFEIPYVIGFSVLQALGHRRLGAMGFWGRSAVTMASLPMLPLAPFLDEFLFAVGRAV